MRRETHARLNGSNSVAKNSCPEWHRAGPYRSEQRRWTRDKFPAGRPNQRAPDSVRRNGALSTDARCPRDRSKIVPAMSMFEGQSQSVRFVRNHNQVNVIRHEAIADQGELMQGGIVSEQVKIDDPLGVGSEDNLSSIATLCNVVRYINGNHASQTSHGRQNNRKRPGACRR